MSSRQYHRSFKACAAGLLLKYKVDEIDLISLFYNNMEASVKEIVVKKYPKHGQIHSRLASDIETELLELLRLGTEAEGEIKQVRESIRMAVSGTAPQFGQLPVAGGQQFFQAQGLPPSQMQSQLNLSP